MQTHSFVDGAEVVAVVRDDVYSVLTFSGEGINRGRRIWPIQDGGKRCPISHCYHFQARVLRMEKEVLCNQAMHTGTVTA